MLRGLWKLTWLETKIFLREPLGVIGTVGFPILLFLLMRRMGRGAPRTALPALLSGDLPILASVMVALSAVVSLVAIIAIYREGGILKRLRATPLRPVTIVAAHVLVKLLLTAATLVLLALLGRRAVSPPPGASLVSFAVALLFSTAAILSLGFLLASVVRTARFAQPFGALVLYPMLALSGVFVPVETLPASLQVVTQVLPLTHAVALLQGAWTGQPWIGQLGHIGALVVFAVASAALASRVFRWE